MSSWMARELAEAPDKVAGLLAANRDVCTALGRRLRKQPPALVVTCGRGSSGHAATYAKYLIETRTGIPVAAAAPSVTSLYGRQLELKGQLAVVISQSGRSPDLVSFAKRAVAAGATLVSAVNDTTSPLGELGHVCLPLHVGPERSVVATKSHIGSLAAVAQMVAAWTEDDLGPSLEQLPENLRDALALDWGHATGSLSSSANLLTVGRGLGLAAAQEAALKLKEACGIHAEGISAAELQHGPMALASPSLPFLVFSQNDQTRPGVLGMVDRLRRHGADVWMVEAGPPKERRLVVPADLYPTLAPIAMIQRFYRWVADMAVARGLDPDAPPHLIKVTETL